MFLFKNFGFTVSLSFHQHSTFHSSTIAHSNPVNKANISLVLQKSVFGGSAWEWNQDRWQFYLHQFLKEQPDLNYRNHLVVQEMKVASMTSNLGISPTPFS